MKKIFPLLLIAAVTLTTGCKSDEEKINDVAYKYSFAMANYDVATAEKYATHETKTTTLVVARQLIERVGNKYIQSDTPATITIEDINILNDTSAIATYHKTTPIKDFRGPLELRKRNHRWLAHATIPVQE